MDLCNQSAVPSSVLLGKQFNFGHCLRTNSTKRSHTCPAILMGTINLYHFIPLSLTLTLAGGTAESKTLLLVA